MEDLPTSFTTDLRKVFLNRDAMFLKPHACAAYFLDDRYWADLLAAPKVRETVQYLLEVVWPLFGTASPHWRTAMTIRRGLPQKYGS